MNKKILIGIIILFIICVGLFILGVNRIIHPIFSTLGLALIPVGVWIYLVWMVREKKTKIFHDQMEPELAERRLKILKVFLRVGGISFVVAIVSAILHNVVYMLFIHFAGEDFWERTGMEDEPVFFWITLVAIAAWIIATIGSLVVFIIGQRKLKPKKNEISRI